ETTANALVWTLYLLAKHPQWQERLAETVRSALGSRDATVEDLGSLELARQVLSESMRLYPPAWVIGREATEPYEAGGYTIPPRSVVLMSQWVVHRDPRWWGADAEQFNPGRWAAE